jgi:hypothetical protein
LTLEWWIRFLIALALLSAFLSADSWTEFLLRAHPDHLFTLVMTAGLALTIRMLQRPEEKVWFPLSAAVWGIAAAVKMTISVAGPGFLLFFIPPFTRENFKRGLRYLGILLAAYFIIGFPQSIVLGRLFRSIAEISGLSHAVTVASLQHWFVAFGLQLWRPVLVLALAWMFFDVRKNPLHKISLWRVLGFVLLPFVVLLTKNMLVPADHYVIPFAGMLIYFLGFLLGRLPSLGGWYPNLGRYPVYRAGAFLALVLMIFGSTPERLQARLQGSLVCREEARRVYDEIVKLYSAGENIWVDPYVPYVTGAPKDRMDMTWDKNWEGYRKNHWTVMALQKGFREKFTAATVNEYTKKDTPDWQATREFYLAFPDSGTMTTPSGDVFKKIYQDRCGHELWKLEPTAAK